MNRLDDRYDFDWLPGFKEMMACQEEKPEMEEDQQMLPPEELQQEELLVLEPLRRFLEFVGVLREMYVPERRLQRHEPFLSEYVVGQGLPDFRQAERERRGFDTVHDLAGDTSVLQFLAARVHSRERRLRHMPVVRNVDFGVDHIDSSVELLRLAEEHEHAPGREPAEVPLDALEEYYFHASASVLHDD